MKTDNAILDKSKLFAIRIVKLYQYLQRDDNKEKEFVISKQILRSGTSIGANVREAVNGYSKKEFRMKLKISLKEASETEYWLDILHETGYISKKMYDSIYADCVELIKIITAIVKTTETNLKNKIL